MNLIAKYLLRRKSAQMVILREHLRTQQDDIADRFAAYFPGVRTFEARWIDQLCEDPLSPLERITEEVSSFHLMDLWAHNHQASIQRLHWGLSFSARWHAVKIIFHTDRILVIFLEDQFMPAVSKMKRHAHTFVVTPSRRQL